MILKKRLEQVMLIAVWENEPIAAQFAKSSSLCQQAYQWNRAYLEPSSQPTKSLPPLS
jgi:hypothetical protein